MKKKLLLFIITFMFLLTSVRAENRTDFIKDTKITINDKVFTQLNDNNYNTYVKFEAGDILNITTDTKADGIYIIYYLEAKEGTLTYDNKKIDVGKNKFLHEFIKLDNATDNITITYNEDVRIKEIFLFSGELPTWVQVWELPHEDADIMLISTHSDDEQLFFAGLIPSSVASGKKMQVVYFANHNDNPSRLDEQLNGLWAIGLKNYPVLGLIPDAYSTNLDGAISNMKSKGYTIDDTIKFEVDMIRKFKPEVVVGHDEAGEYGHGQHILNTYTLKEALKVLDDATYESTYEPFMPYKVYLHLYKENPIVMDYDIPLDYFNGLTAYEVSKLGYAEHLSQQYTWFTRWLTGVNQKGEGSKYESVKDIKAVKSPITGVVSTFSPLEYGLYYSSVGYENEDNNMFYNIPEPVVEEPTSEEETKVIEVTKAEEKTPNYYLLIIPGVSLIVLISLIIYSIKRKKH